MKASRAWLILIFMVFAVSPTWADYHYASHEGSNEYPYTSWETGALVIQDAVDATEPRDTVFIGSGHWYQHVQTGVYDSVTLIGKGTDSTFCHNDSSDNNIFDIEYGCSVENISFIDGGPGACIYAQVFAGVYIANCKFINSAYGIALTGGEFPAVIENCIFDNCSGAIGNYVTAGDIIIRNNMILGCYDPWAIITYAYSLTVENNIIINQEGATIVSIGGNPLAGSIRNNVIVHGDYGIATRIDTKINNIVKDMDHLARLGITARSGTNVINNLVMNCLHGVGIFEDSTSIINYNAFWGNEIDIYGVPAESIGNIHADPMLVSETDFHLQAFSPLIDAGDPDIYDPDNSRSDIGAYGGPLGDIYEYPDLPPRAPDSLTGEIIADTAFINWLYNTEADFHHYYLHRDTVSGFTPSWFNLISEPDTSYYLDIDIIPGKIYYYRISAIDNQGNLSEYSDELAVIPTDIWNGVGVEPPRITTINTNYPNPFNSQTTIVYYVANLGPIPADIKIEIYDITGRKVRTLLHERKEVGAHRIIWDGRSDSGDDCRSGVYFARIVQWDLGFLGRHRKLVLIR